MHSCAVASYSELPSSESTRPVCGNAGSSAAVQPGGIVSAGKRGRKNKSLMRPVICICNDLYAPVIRPLRAVALSFTFKAPTVRIFFGRVWQL